MAKYSKLGSIPLLVLSISIGLVAVFGLFSGFAFNSPNLLLQSEISHGSTFTVKIPLVKKDD